MRLQKLRRLIEKLDRGEKISRVDFQWIYGLITQLETNETKNRRHDNLRREQSLPRQPGD